MRLTYSQALRNFEGNETFVDFDVSYTELNGGLFVCVCPVPGCRKIIESEQAATDAVRQMRTHLIIQHDFSMTSGISEGLWKIER